MRGDYDPIQGYSASVRTFGQLNSVIDYISQDKEKGASLVRLIIDSDLYLADRRVRGLIQKTDRGLREKRPHESEKNFSMAGPGAGISETGLCRVEPGDGPEWALSLPAVLRESDRAYLSEVFQAIRDSEVISGVFTGSLEGLGYFLEQGYSGKLYADANFYLWNSGAAALWDQTLCGACLPLELRAGEQRELMRRSSLSWEKLVYGRIPMMVSANCVSRTFGRCLGQTAFRTSDGCGEKKTGRIPDRCGREEPEPDVLWIRDRLGKEFPVLLNCRHCFNTIYNHVPLSLHREIDKWADKAVLRLQFTIENGEETTACLDFFLRGREWKTSIGPASGQPPFGEYTTGHEKRGVQ